MKFFLNNKRMGPIHSTSNPNDWISHRTQTYNNYLCSRAKNYNKVEKKKLNIERGNKERDGLSSFLHSAIPR